MDTRERLLDAASELISTGGLSAATLRAVGHRAGVSHNAPYKHFKNRRELLAGVAAGELDRIRRDFDALPPGPPGIHVHAMALAIVRAALERPELYVLTHGPEIRGADSPQLDAAASAVYRRLVDGIAHAQQAGELPGADPERLSALIRATAHGAAYLARNGHLGIDGKGKASPKDVVDDLFAYLAKFLAAHLDQQRG